MSTEAPPAAAENTDLPPVVLDNLSFSVRAMQEQVAKLEEEDAKRTEEVAALREDMSDIKAYLKAIGEALKLKIPPDTPAPRGPSARRDRPSVQDGVTAEDSDNSSKRSAHSHSPSRSIAAASLADSEMARIKDQSAWSGKRLPRKVKIEALPLLGTKDVKGKPFHKWKVDARAVIAAGHGAEWVLDIEPPTNDDLDEVKAWYEPVEKMVYAGILKSVSEVPILSDVVRRLQGKWGSGHSAWWAVHNHYVRIAEENRTFLAAKVNALKPKERESMEAFLNRCEALREEHLQYGLVLEDALLLTQVFGHLALNWRVNTGINNVAYTSLKWDFVRDKLQREDNNRRQSNTVAEDATLPLGWTKAYAAARVAGAGESPESSNTPFGAANKGEGASPGKRFENAKQGGAPKQFKKKGLGPILVCYCCKKSGHVWTECRNKPDGWEPKDEDKAEADKKRAERMAQSKAAKAARAGGQAGESSFEGNASAVRASTSTSGGQKSGESRDESHPKTGRVTLPQV